MSEIFLVEELVWGGDEGVPLADVVAGLGGPAIALGRRVELEMAAPDVADDVEEVVWAEYFGLD
jgi:hypothetical protein